MYRQDTREIEATSLPNELGQKLDDSDRQQIMPASAEDELSSPAVEERMEERL